MDHTVNFMDLSRSERAPTRNFCDKEAERDRDDDDQALRSSEVLETHVERHYLVGIQ